MGVKVSIILTVHNSERTLQKCIDSAMHQTLNDIEILCIDGGSRDNSPHILENNAKVDNRIRIINDANTSYGHKINRGIDEATGEYISILESDDTMKLDMLDKLYNHAVRFGVDFVDGNYEAICHFKDLTYSQLIRKYSNESCYDNIIAYDNRETVLKEASGAIWTGLYKTSFIRNNKIYMYESEGASFQDTSFRFLVGMYARKSYHIRDSVYLYQVDNLNSSIHDQNKIYAIAKEYNFLKNELDMRNATDIERKCFIKWKYSSYLWNVSRLNKDARKKFLVFYIKELRADMDKGLLPRKEDMSNAEYMNTYMLFDDYNLFKELLEAGSQGGNFNTVYIINFLKKIYGKKFVIFGCGTKGKGILKGIQNNKVEILGICDNNTKLQGTEFMGIKIYSVEEAVKLFADHLFIIPGGKYADEMKMQLSGLGVSDENMYITEY